MQGTRARGPIHKAACLLLAPGPWPACRSAATRAAMVDAEPGVSQAVFSTAAEAKAKGGQEFAQGNFEAAIECYTAAIQLCEAADHTLYSNRSAAYASLTKYEEALSDAEECIKCNSEFAKGYSRKGYALSAQGKFTAAIQVRHNTALQSCAGLARFGVTLPCV